MYKKSEGVTLVSLVLTIVVMFILIGVTIESGTELLRSSKLKTVITNMMLIQSRAEVIYEKYTFDDTLSFDAGKVKINQDANRTAEQLAMANELIYRQIFSNTAATNNRAKELSIDVAAEKSYYNHARFQRNADGSTVKTNGVINRTTIFLGDENAEENWFIWDKEYVQEQVSDKIEIGDNEYFLVNAYTHEVLYSAGYKDQEGNLYFLLSDMVEGK